MSKVSTRVLVVNTLCFALCFAAWVALGPCSRQILTGMGLPLSWAPILKSIPILTGSALRIPVGLLVDRIGARKAFSLLLVSSAAACFWLSAASSWQALVLGALWLGMVGTSFAVGTQSVSSWTPPSQQGMALGVFGAGNVGTALTTFCLPLLMQQMGWQSSLRVYGVVLLGAALAYWRLVPNASSNRPKAGLLSLLAPLAAPTAWLLGLYYMATFGAFVALTLMASDLYIDAFGLSPVQAGLMATTFTFSTSLCRIPGGILADRLGPTRVLTASLALSTLALMPVCLGLNSTLTVGLIFLAGIAMGFGMAAVMKDVAVRFPQRVGAVGGIVGALGGMAGFFFPQLGALSRSLIFSPFAQILPLCLLGLAALVCRGLDRAQEQVPSTILAEAA